MVRWFTLHGYNTDSAENGLEAVNNCQEKSYDLITMDLEMPKMHGLRAIATIRTMHPDMPIIALTGHASEIPLAEEAGADRVLLKPMRLHDLESHVCELLKHN